MYRSWLFCFFSLMFIKIRKIHEMSYSWTRLDIVDHIGEIHLFCQKKKLLVLCFVLHSIIYHYTLTLQDWLLPTFEYFSREIGVSDVILHRSLNSILWKSKIIGPKWCRNLGDISKNVSPVQTYVVQYDTRSTNHACSFKIGSKTRMECFKPLQYTISLFT